MWLIRRSGRNAEGEAEAASRVRSEETKSDSIVATLSSAYLPLQRVCLSWMDARPETEDIATLEFELDA